MYELTALIKQCILLDLTWFFNDAKILVSGNDAFTIREKITIINLLSPETN